MPTSETLYQVVGDIGENKRNVRDLWELRRKIVPFVGAGLSMQLGYPSWGQLVLGLLQSSDNDIQASHDDRSGVPNDTPIVTEVKALLKLNKYEEAASAVFDALAPKDLRKRLEKQLNKEKLRRPVNGAVAMLPRIARGSIITTNLDRVLECAFDDAGKHFPTVLSGPGIFTSSKALPQDKRILIKLHGDYEDPKNWVLTLDQYERAYESQGQEVPAVLHQVFIGGVVLFLGCSLGTDRIMTVLHKITQNYNVEHFALLNESENRDDRAKQFFDWKIRPIFFREDKYYLIEEFLGVLAGVPRSRTGSRQTRRSAKKTESQISEHGAQDAPPVKLPQIVHPYRLLDSTRGLIGRMTVLRDLNAWIRPSDGYSVLILQAIGGTGKSAATWTWFNKLFENCEPSTSRENAVTGGMWYSFSDPGSSFTDFLRKLHDYVMGPSEVPIEAQSIQGQTFAGLFDRLRRERYVIVLDSFESVLRASSKEKLTYGDTANLAADSEFVTERTWDLCLGVDENVNSFIQSLSQALSSRFLITTRLIPSAAVNDANEPRPFTKIVELKDLNDDEVMELLAAYRVTGTRDRVIDFTHRLGNNAQLVKLVAGMVAIDRWHPHQFDPWLESLPQFVLSDGKIANNIDRLFEYALGQLKPFQVKVLLHVTTLSGAVSYKELCDLLLDDDGIDRTQLNEALDVLDQLNLIEWDRGEDRNTYSYHPLVQLATWRQTSTDTRAEIDEKLIEKLSADPRLGSQYVRQRDLYFACVRRHRFERAWRAYGAICYQSGGGLGISQADALQMLTALSVPSHEPWPQLVDREDRASFSVALAAAYELSGDLKRAEESYRRHRPLCDSPACRAHEARVLNELGRLVEAENINRHVVAEIRKLRNWELEIPALRNWFMDSQSLRGAWAEVIRREAVLVRRLPMHFLRSKELKVLVRLRCAAAQECAEEGSASALKKWKGIAARWLAQEKAEKNVYGEMSAAAQLALIARLEGQYDQCLRDLDALCERARRFGMAQVLWQMQLWLVITRTKASLFQEAENALQELIPASERTGDRCLMTCVRLAEAELFEKMGRNIEAISSAKLAYSLAWCDGPPFSFMKELVLAEALVQRLGGVLPSGLPHKTLPSDWIELEIDPKEDGYAPSRRERREPDAAVAALYVPSVADEGSSYVDTLLQWSREQNENGKADIAEQAAELAINLDPMGHDCWAARGDARRKTGNIADAARDYDRAIELAGEEEFWVDLYKSLLAQLA